MFKKFPFSNNFKMCNKKTTFTKISQLIGVQLPLLTDVSNAVCN